MRCQATHSSCRVQTADRSHFVHSFHFAFSSVHSIMADKEQPTLCKKQDCSFYGSPGNDGFCSGCAPKKATPASSSAGNESSRPIAFITRKRSSVEMQSNEEAIVSAVAAQNQDPALGTGPVKETPKRRKVNRCGICRKKVGLLGFDCRCGGLFCPLHRGDNDHDCQFDYKTLQRAELAEKNPQVVAEKVSKI